MDAPAEEAPAMEEAPEVGVDLTADICGQYLSALALTGDALGYAYTRIDLQGKKLANLKGLEGFHHLRHIDVSNNMLTEVGPLSGTIMSQPTFTHLMTLNLSNNRLTATTAIITPPKPSLQILDLSHNRIEIGVTQAPPAPPKKPEDSENPDATQEGGEPQASQPPAAPAAPAPPPPPPTYNGKALFGHPMLSTIKASFHCGCTFPQEFKEFRLLDCIWELTSLQQCRRLQRLSLASNLISSLDALAARPTGLPVLEAIDLAGNRIESFEECAKLAALKGLRALSLKGLHLPPPHTPTHPMIRGPAREEEADLRRDSWHHAPHLRQPHLWGVGVCHRLVIGSPRSSSGLLGVPRLDDTPVDAAEQQEALERKEQREQEEKAKAEALKAEQEERERAAKEAAEEEARRKAEEEAAKEAAGEGGEGAPEEQTA
ncbi:hypothetical protein PAPYR_4990 [Paratrimastix pyriformis]|uniref:Uncharacterized protein n=1 Tax=Paratrimastix pyriformis TaxID=342808 RepID=A0ABQ8UPC3_9EUKA|nr:hypothetical protein PAPYR_4990 [Paratrimastix pyriformis]